MTTPSYTVYPSLGGQRVAITGGASGIGAELVTAFVRQGCEVHFLDRMAPANPPAQAQFHLCDLQDTEAIARTFAAIGPLDVLVNNAGNDDRHTLAEVTPAYFDDRIGVNLRHMLFCAQAVVGGMQARGGGSIINFGSIAWHLGLENLVLYETAKAGIEGMTRALARELGSQRIRVNCILPGNVETPRQAKWYTPEGEAAIIAAQCLKARIQPSDVAAMALFLASADARMCTGHNYWVDAGWR
ncbi:MAG: SDR family oxidoreductase [Rhodoferax sp.]|uniref:SDR family NAD(P)-dependent oxidoreductase n=1 Tax=Rhodoferax sp. TaxID=50421 RepID=UPI0032651815